MPDTAVQGIIPGPMIDREIDGDLRDLHIGHNPVLMDIQQLLIACGGILHRLLGKGHAGYTPQGGVIRPRCLHGVFQSRVVHLAYCFGILGFDQTPVSFGIGVCYKGIERDADGQQDSHGKECELDGSFHAILLKKAERPESLSAIGF